MLNFVYDNKTTLIFGKGTHHETGTLLKPLGKKILLHYGSGSIRRSGLYDAVTASLKAAGVEYEELGGVQANPTLPLVYEGIRLCREHGLGLVHEIRSSLMYILKDHGCCYHLQHKKSFFSILLPCLTYFLHYL